MADIFNEDGKYNKTDWESGDRITANKLNRIEMAIEQINDNDNQRHVEADGRLDNLEAGLTETKDKVDNIDMAYKTADTVLTNRVNSVETSYKAADTTLNNRVNSVETAYKTSETNLTNKFNNLNTAYQNAVSNLTAKFNSLETAYKAADTKMTNNINNLDAAYKAADVEIQNEINELQNSVPINVSQLINDMNYVTEDYLAGYNLLSNTIFPNKDTYFWNIWNNMRVIESNDPYYYGREGTLCIKSDAIYSDKIESGILVKLGRGTFYHNYIRVEPETAYTFSFYCKWEENIASCDYFIEYYDENMEVIEDATDILDMKELENDFNKRQSITFTTPQNAYYVICGFGHDGVITADIGNNAIFINKPAIKKGTSDVWSPESTNIPPHPGDWWNNGAAIVSNTGATSIGGHLYFHASNDDMTDGGLIAYAGDNHFFTNCGFIPAPHAAHTLGNSGAYWKEIYSQNFKVESGGLKSRSGLVELYGTDQDLRLVLQSKTTANFNCFRPDGDNVLSLGHSAHRWSQSYFTYSPTVTSDRTLKENIEYVKNENSKAVATDEVVTYKDMYDFVKDDLELATYNFKGDVDQQMNFIAQDLLYNLDGSDNKVGQMIVKPIAPPPGEDPDMEVSTLSYDSGMYMSVLAGALKESLHQIEQLKARIDELENK